MFLKPKVMTKQSCLQELFAGKFQRCFKPELNFIVFISSYAVRINYIDSFWIASHKCSAIQIKSWNRSSAYKKNKVYIIQGVCNKEYLIQGVQYSVPVFTLLTNGMQELHPF